MKYAGALHLSLGTDYLVLQLVYDRQVPQEGLSVNNLVK